VPRPPRDQEAGGIYHVFARGNYGQVIFRDDRDRRRYLGHFSQAIRRHRWHCLSYCLMHNHVHLVLETPEPNLAHGMQRLQGGYAQGFNRRNARIGHLFQGRYGSVRVASDGQLWSVVRYVVLNPVAAGFCHDAVDYAWSSHGAVMHGVASPFVDVARLLSYVGDAAGSRAPRERYAELIGDAAPLAVTAS
jgi:putative transposase